MKSDELHKDFEFVLYDRADRLFSKGCDAEAELHYKQLQLLAEQAVAEDDGEDPQSAVKPNLAFVLERRAVLCMRKARFKEAALLAERAGRILDEYRNEAAKWSLVTHDDGHGLITFYLRRTEQNDLVPGETD